MRNGRGERWKVIRKELVGKSKVEDKTKGTILRQTSSSFTLDHSHSIKHSLSSKC